MIEETVGFLDIILREGQHTVNNVVAGYKITGVLTPIKAANRENKLPIFFFLFGFFSITVLGSWFMLPHLSLYGVFLINLISLFLF